MIGSGGCAVLQVLSEVNGGRNDGCIVVEVAEELAVLEENTEQSMKRLSLITHIGAATLFYCVLTSKSSVETSKDALRIQQTNLHESAKGVKNRHIAQETGKRIMMLQCLGHITI